MEQGVEPTVAIAFDVELGRMAAREGHTLGIDQRIVRHAALHGGMTAEECETYPIIISHSNGVGSGGFTEPPNEHNGYQPRIVVFVDGPQGAISSKRIAHEASHMRDILDGVAQPRREITKRKVVAATIGALAGVAFGHLTGSHFGELLQNIFEGVSTDALLSASLYSEYRLRSEERRAERAEALDGANILVLFNSEGDPAVIPAPPRTARQIGYRCLRSVVESLRGAFLPRFDL